MDPPQKLLPTELEHLARFHTAAPAEPVPETPWPGAVVYPEAVEQISWRALAHRLAEGGRVAFPCPPAGTPERAILEGSLAAAGFALRQEVEGWRLATPTPFPVRPYRSGDEEAILDLFQNSFHHQRGANHWRWQYLENPSDSAGEPRVIVATDSDGALVGHYAGYPVTFQRHHHGRLHTFLGHQIGDTMTAPQVRHIGRGPTSLLARCGRAFYARFGPTVAFNYGFNVGNIQKFSIRFLDAHRVEDVPFWRRPAAAPLTPSPRGWLGGRRYRIEIDAQPDYRWDALLQEVGPRYGALVRRNAEHLRWRYGERPGFRYRPIAAVRHGKVVGWGIFRRDGERLLWGDLLLDPAHPQALGEILRGVLEEEEHRGIESVEGWFTPRPAFLPPLLRQLHFEQIPEPQGLALMCVPFGDPTAPTWLGEELYYTLGDSDLF